MSDIFNFEKFIAAGNAANNQNHIPQTPIANTQNITYLTESFHPNSRFTDVRDSAPNIISHENFSDKSK